MYFVHLDIEFSTTILIMVPQRLGNTYICNIISREQYLGNGLPKETEKCIPHAHELALTYCCQSLLNEFSYALVIEWSLLPALLGDASASSQGASSPEPLR